MVLYVRSIYIAIKGLWRFLIVLPFLASATGIVIITLSIGLLLMTAFYGVRLAPLFIAGAMSGGDIMAAVGGAAYAIGAVFAALIILALTLTSAGFIFIGLVAIRTSLMAEGEFNAVDLVRLLKSAGKYAAFFTLIYLAVGSLMLFVAFILTQLGLSDLPKDFWLAKETAPGFIENSRMLKGMGIAYVVFYLALNAAMMVPMAASAWSATDKMQPLDMYWGFGSSFITMVLVSLSTIAVNYYLGLTASVMKLFVFLSGYGYAKLAKIKPPEITWVELQPLLIALGITVALFYWQYVAAALGLLKRQAKLESARIAAGRRPKSEWVDPTELRRARENQESRFV